MGVRNNSRNKALLKDLERNAQRVQLEIQEVKDVPAEEVAVVSKKEITDTPTSISEAKPSAITQYFNKSIRSLVTIITKSYLSICTFYTIILCYDDHISNIR